MPPQRPWRWGSFFGGFVVGFLGVLLIGMGLRFVLGLGGRRIGGAFFLMYVPLLAAFAAGNVVLERRRFLSRGYAVGLVISLGLNGLCCGMCALDDFRGPTLH